VARYPMDVRTQSLSLSAGQNHCPSILLSQFQWPVHFLLLPTM
jgi:hypothetical protein